jgi:histidyl-tRNA synthetase
MEKALATERDLDIYIVVAKEERRADALAQVQTLRDAGYRLDYPLGPAKVGKQFQTAELLGARVAILFGDEWPEVKLKDLRTGEQSLVAHQEVAAKLTALFSA